MLVLHYGQLTLPAAQMAFGQNRFPSALLGGGMNCISEPLGTSQEDFHEGSEAMLPLKPGRSGRGDFSILLLIPLDWVLEWDYFRKCERAKFYIWFTLFWDFKLWCKLVWNRSFFHFLFSKCNTVKWQRLITKVITVGKQRDSCMRHSFLWWPSLSWQLCLIPTMIILCGKIYRPKGTGAGVRSYSQGNIRKRCSSLYSLGSHRDLFSEAWIIPYLCSPALFSASSAVWEESRLTYDSA